MAKDLWNTIRSFGLEEAKRVRNCRGCTYLNIVGCSACCDYWLIEDRLRPSKFGEKGCPVKIVISGYTIPPEHEDFCRRVDEQERRQKETAERQAKLRLERIERINRRIEQQAKKDENNTELHLEHKNHPHENRGRSASWDCDYAFQLYIEGYYNFEIAEIVGTTVQKVASYARNNNWQKYLPPDIFRVRHDMEQARMDYQKYRAKLKENEQ